MAYKNKKELVQVGIRLNNDQKIKLMELMAVNINGMDVQISAAKIISKIVTDYLDGLPNVVDSSTDETNTKGKAKKGTVSTK